MIKFAGQKFMLPDGDYIKIMAIVDNYVMARRNGCIPFVKSCKEFDLFIKNEIK